MLAIHLPQQAYQSLLLVAFGGTFEKPMIDKVIEACQLLEPILAAKFIKARDPMLSVTDEVQGCNVNLIGRRV